MKIFSISVKMCYGGVQNNARILQMCPEIKDTKVWNKYNIFNLQKWHCEWIAYT